MSDKDEFLTPEQVSQVGDRPSKGTRFVTTEDGRTLDLHELAARVAHEVGRTYVEEVHGTPLPSWQDTPPGLRTSTIERVQGIDAGEETTSKGDRVHESIFAATARAVLAAFKG